MNINELIPTNSSSENETNKNVDEKIDWFRDEWCGLSKADLVDIQSDVEDEIDVSKRRNAKRKR